MMHVCGVVIAAGFAAVVTFSAEVPEPPPALVLESPDLFMAAVFAGVFAATYAPIFLGISVLEGRIIKSAGRDGIAFESQFVAGVSDALHGSGEATAAAKEGLEALMARLDRIEEREKMRAEIYGELFESDQDQRRAIALLKDDVAERFTQLEGPGSPDTADTGSAASPK
jgi:hypothetical protein